MPSYHFIFQMSLRFNGVEIFSNLQSGKYLSIRITDFNFCDEVLTSHIFMVKMIHKAWPFYTQTREISKLVSGFVYFEFLMTLYK